MTRTRDQWVEWISERGTRGELVYDILRDWKEEQEQMGSVMVEYVYLILEETDAYGAWDTPEKAVAWYLRYEIESGECECTVGEMVAKMLDPYGFACGYPHLVKVKVNPAPDDVWST